MTFTITQRDKKLLSILAVVLIAALFIKFLILPQMEAKTDLEAKRIEVKSQVMEMKRAIESKETLEEKLQEAEKEFQKASETYYPLMQSYEIESLVTKMILNNGMESRDLEVSSKSYQASATPYFASKLALEMGLSGENAEAAADAGADTADTTAPSQGAEGEEETLQSSVYASEVNVTAVGTLEQAKHLIDVVNRDYPSMRIRTFSIESEEAETTDGTAVSLTTLNLGLEVYMCEK